MTLTLAAGESTTLTATAYLDEAATAVDEAAEIFWEAEGENPAVTLAEHPTAAGVGSCTVTATAVETAVTVGIRAYAADPDGHVTPLSEPFAIDVAATPAPTPEPVVADAVKVVITGPADAAPDASGTEATPPAATATA